MEKISDEEIAVISSAISAYLDLENQEIEKSPISKWKVAGRNEGIHGYKKISNIRIFKNTTNFKWKITGKLNY